MEQAKYFAQNKRCSDGSHERGAYGLARKQRDAALVERSSRQQIIASCHESRIIGSRRDFIFPELLRRSLSRKRVDQYASEIAMASPQPGFDNKIETRRVKSAPSRSVVYAAKRDRRFIDTPPGVRVEETLGDGRLEAAMLGPGSHAARFPMADKRGVCQNRRAIGGWRDDIVVLQQKEKIGRLQIGQETECP